MLNIAECDVIHIADVVVKIVFLDVEVTKHTALQMSLNSADKDRL